jgi:hypothetical protein
MFWNRCCKNHSLKDEVATNVQAFIDGCHAYWISEVPTIKTEGVCKRCGAVVRQERFWYERDLDVIKALMKEIRDLKKNKDNAENYGKNSERLAMQHYEELVKTRHELETLKAKKKK